VASLMNSTKHKINTNPSFPSASRK
jgi:hypothetical protein